MNETTQKRQGNFLTRLVRKQIFIPLAALLLLIVFNLIADPSFFAITLKENSLGDLVLTGNLITILDNASELVILAIGMTLVTAASGGQAPPSPLRAASCCACCAARIPARIPCRRPSSWRFWPAALSRCFSARSTARSSPSSRSSRWSRP